MTRKMKLYLALGGLSLLFLLVLGAGIMWISGSGGTPLWSSEPLYQERFADVEAVACRLRSCAVEVRTWSEPDVEVSFYRWGIGTLEPPRVWMENGRLTAEDESHFSILLIGGGRLVIQVPEGTALPYDLLTVSGSVKLDAPSAEAVLETTSGSVKVFQAGTALKAQTVSGSIKVYEPFVIQDLKTTSGSVKAAADAATEEVRMQTTSGSIKLRLEDVSGYVLTHHVTSGSVKDLYRNVSFGRDGVENWGDETLKIYAGTTSGSIKLTDWTD